MYYNEPLYDEDPDLTSHISRPSNSKMYEKEPDTWRIPVITNAFCQSLGTSFMSGFHCTTSSTVARCYPLFSVFM